MLTTYYTNTITNAGATITFDVEQLADGQILVPSANPLTMLANIVVNFTGTPKDGQIVRVGWSPGFTLNGNSMTINGIALSDLQALNEGSIEFAYINGGWGDTYAPDLRTAGTLSGAVLSDETVTLAKIEDVTAAQIIVGNSSNRPTAVAVTGDVTISNAGVTAIGAGVIVNADVNASAAIAVTKLAAKTASTIARYDASGFLTDTGAFLVNADVNASAAIALSKLAALTASKVAVTDGSGVITTANQLSALLGGNGIDNSAATGFPVWAAGTQSVGAIAELITLNVSWNTGYVGDFKIKMPFAGTVTEIYGYITQATVGATAGTCTAKNNAGTTLTAGVITTTAGGDARGTAYTVTPTANNTFVDGDILTFTTATATAGEMQLSIKITRSA